MVDAFNLELGLDLSSGQPSKTSKRMLLNVLNPG